MALQNRQEPPVINNDVLKQFFDNQRMELELRKENIQLQKDQLNYSHQYAMKALEAQREDLADQRKNEQKTQSKNIWIVLIIIISLLGFIAFCLWIDKDEVVKEVIKFLMYSAPFSVGGYYFGYHKGKNKNTENGYPQETVSE